MDRLIEAIEEAQNPSVVGLDPTPALVPPQVVDSFTDEVRESIEDESELPAARLAVAYFEFNRAIIDAVADIVPAVKPQIAMYEAIGPAGVDTYTMTCEYAQQQGLYVLGDIKRGDIGSTAAAYAGHLSGVTDGDGLYDPWHEDAVTVNLISARMASRRSSRQPRRTTRTSSFLYGRPTLPAPNCRSWSLPAARSCTNVQRTWWRAGARHHRTPRVFARRRGRRRDPSAGGQALRARMPHTFFLVPGYGAQGGKAGDVAGMFDADGSGVHRELLARHHRRMAQERGIPRGHERRRRARPGGALRPQGRAGHARRPARQRVPLRR